MILKVERESGCVFIDHIEEFDIRRIGVIRNSDSGKGVKQGEFAWKNTRDSIFLKSMDDIGFISLEYALGQSQEFDMVHVQSDSRFFHIGEIKKTDGETISIAFDDSALLMSDNGVVVENLGSLSSVIAMAS